MEARAVEASPGAHPWTQTSLLALIEPVSSTTGAGAARTAAIPYALTGNIQDINNDEEIVTTPVVADGQDQTRDVVSDPAKDDTEGQDWSHEGGATPSGPATNDEKPAG